MPNRRYAKGARMERAVKHALEARGYAVVRSAGSKSPYDLIAIDSQDVLLVQCKSNRLSQNMRERLRNAMLGGSTANTWRRLRAAVLDADWRRQVQSL